MQGKEIRSFGGKTTRMIKYFSTDDDRKYIS